MEHNLILPTAIGFAPMPAVARILASFDRPTLEAFLTVAVELMDAADGDPDDECNADQEASDGDDRGDQAWVEWNSMRGAAKRGPNILAGQEDDEDDDPGEPDDDDSAVDDKGCDDINDDREVEEGTFADYPVDQSQGPIAPWMGGDRALMLPHLERIRATRCDKITYGGTNGGYVCAEYRLRPSARSLI